MQNNDSDINPYQSPASVEDENVDTMQLNRIEVSDIKQKSGDSITGPPRFPEGVWKIEGGGVILRDVLSVYLTPKNKTNTAESTTRIVQVPIRSEAWEGDTVTIDTKEGAFTATKYMSYEERQKKKIREKLCAILWNFQRDPDLRSQ